MTSYDNLTAEVGKSQQIAVENSQIVLIKIVKKAKYQKIKNDFLDLMLKNSSAEGHK